jgi:hypothetical protein
MRQRRDARTAALAVNAIAVVVDHRLDAVVVDAVVVDAVVVDAVVVFAVVVDAVVTVVVITVVAVMQYRLI